MGLNDLLLTPIYIAIIFAIATLIKPKLTNNLTKKYYNLALALKLFGAISVGLIYFYYYGGGRPSGDTFRYFNQSKVIVEAFKESPTKGLRLFTANKENVSPDLYEYTSRIHLFRDKNSYFIVKITAVLAYLTFETYTAIACFFALLSFIGVFLLYATFVKIVPKLHKQFAYTILFLPSLFFWGSGILKDSLTLGALGLLFYTFYTGFVERKNMIQSLLFAILAGYIILSIKSYILLSFLPALIFYVFIQYRKAIKNKALQMLMTPVLIIVGGFGAFLLTTALSSETQYTSLDEISTITKTSADYIYLISEESGGSSYHLGEMDGTFAGMVKLAPQAIVVSLYRPFLWEARNPVMLLSALESFYIVYLTLSLIFKSGLKKFLKLIASQPILILCIIFSLVFAFAVGISTNNFGSLVRYRIPLLPFYIAAMLIIKEMTTKKRPVKRSFQP